MNNVVRVGMADYKICMPPKCLLTLGLGSCVGVVIYDTKTKLAGMAHVMLPNSQLIKHNDNRFKFVDTCVVDMLKEMLRKGSNKKNLVAKIAGGARMFAFNTNNNCLNIGEKNVEAVICLMEEWCIPIIASDTGDTYGRTIEFSSETGDLTIKAVGLGVTVI